MQIVVALFVQVLRYLCLISMYGLPKISQRRTTAQVHYHQHQLSYLQHCQTHIYQHSPLDGKIPHHIQNSVHFVSNVQELKLDQDESV